MWGLWRSSLHIYWLRCVSKTHMFPYRNMIGTLTVFLTSLSLVEPCLGHVIATPLFVIIAGILWLDRFDSQLLYPLDSDSSMSRSCDHDYRKDRDWFNSSIRVKHRAEKWWRGDLDKKDGANRCSLKTWPAFWLAGEYTSNIWIWLQIFRGA